MKTRTRVLLATHDAMQATAARAGFGLASYNSPTRAATFSAIRKLQGQRKMLLSPLEAYQIFTLVQRTAKVGGAMAEVGVYAGASARLIRQADGNANRPLHLFDTFRGLPDTMSTDIAFRAGRFEKGDYACSLENVRAYLDGCEGLSFHEGLFPQTASPIERVRFSFVHSDVDLYDGTRSVLEFFYPRMLAGGVILTHDFVTAAGPRRAWEEFFDSRPDPIIELAGNQAMIVKLETA